MASGISNFPAVGATEPESDFRPSKQKPLKSAQETQLAKLTRAEKRTARKALQKKRLVAKKRAKTEKKALRRRVKAREQRQNREAKLKKARAKAEERQNRPQTYKEGFARARARVWAWKEKHAVGPHRSFRRSYREDYYRSLSVPSLSAHALNTLKVIRRNWKTFLCLLVLAMGASIVLVGLMSEETYVSFQDAYDEAEASLDDISLGSFARAAVLLVSTVSTGGLSTSNEEATFYSAIIFLIVWLVSAYLVRHFLAGRQPKFRDALYQACAPLISTLALFLLILVELVPVFIIIVVYSAAVSTEFLETPVYALATFAFCLAMIALSAYLVPSTVIALAAVTAPGLYPLEANRAAGELMRGRKLRLVLRVLYLAVVLVICWAVVMIPVIMIDTWVKAQVDWFTGWPVVPVMMLLMSCLTFIYVSVYFYLFYREVLASDQRLLAQQAKSTGASLRADSQADDTEILHAVPGEKN